jgi:hypothetical protein
MMRKERRVQGNESGRPAGDCRRKERGRLGDKKLVIGERRLRAVRFVWGRTGSLDGSRGEKEDKLKSDLELAVRSCLLVSTEWGDCCSASVHYTGTTGTTVQIHGIILTLT